MAPPVVPATTFAFDTAATFARVMAEEQFGYLYSRIRNPTVEAVGAVMADLEGAEAAQVAASGMSAIAATLLSLLAPGDTLLAARQLYGNTYSFVETRLRGLGVDVVYADATDPAAWERPATVRYVETIANPGLPVADIAAVARTKGDGLLVVDNTFASPILCRPLELGADVVCESATKYLGGHHDVTAGVVAGPAALVRRVRAWIVDLGAVLDPFGAYLLHRGLKTLALRVERASENALALARFLEGRKGVARVHYAGLESYAQHELAVRQLAGFGGVMAVEIEGGRRGAERVMDSLELCLRATSLGGVETVVSHPAATSHRQLSPEQLEAAGISQGLLRVSVGCEDADDLVADFRRALDRL